MRRKLILTVSLAVAFFTLLLFLLSTHQAQPLDRWVDNSVKDLYNPLVASIVTALTHLNSPSALLVWSLLAGGLLLLKQRIRETLYFLSGVWGAALMTTIVKHLVQRLRPEERLVEIHSYSFPSWHSATSAALAIAVWILWIQPLPASSSKRLLTALALLWPLLIGLSRIYLHAHWFSDVLAGWSLGVAVAGTTTLFYFNERSKGSA